MVAEQLGEDRGRDSGGEREQQDSAFGWTPIDLRASTAVECNGVLTELEHYVPRTRQPSATAALNERPRHGIRTIAMPCGQRLARDGRSAFVADATISSGCFTEATEVSA